MGRKESRKGKNNASCRTGSGIQNLANDAYRNKLPSSVQNGVVASSPPERMMRSSSSKENSKRHRSLRWLGLIVNVLVVVLGCGSVLFQWEEIRRILQQPKMIGYQMTYIMSPYFKRPISHLGDGEDETLTPEYRYGLDDHVIDRTYSNGNRSMCDEMDTVEVVEPPLRYV